MRISAREACVKPQFYTRSDIKLFLFYIFLNNTLYCSVSLYYKNIEMSAKHEYIYFFSFLSVNRSLYTAAHGIQRASRTEKVRARGLVFKSTSFYK